MIDWDADLLGACHEVFDEEIRFEPKGGEAFGGGGTFDEAFRDLALAGGSDIQSVIPVLGVRLAALKSEPKQGDSVVVVRLGLRYAVREVRPDGHGWALLHLNYSGLA